MLRLPDKTSEKFTSKKHLKAVKGNKRKIDLTWIRKINDDLKLTCKPRYGLTCNGNEQNELEITVARVQP